MNAEERLAELTAGDRRRQARRREALREKGMAQQNIWLGPDARAVIDEAIEKGRFKNRSEAIDWAIRSVFGQETSMT